MTHRQRFIGAFVALFVLVAAAPAVATEEDTVTIEGAGWGHGIGMSQYGAYSMNVDDGWTYDQILGYYYTGTTIGATTWTDNLWVNLRQEVTAVTLRVDRADPSVAAGNATVTRTLPALDPDPPVVETVEVIEGNTVTISYVTDPTAGCMFSAPGFASVVGPCDIDITWDGWETSPTTAIADIGCSAFGVQCRYARGEMHIRLDNNTATFHLSAEMTLEHYVEGIGEIPGSWPSEVQKMQAVASRSFGVFNATSRTAGGVTVANRTWCWCVLYDTAGVDQSYIGWIRPIAPLSNYPAAVAATAGQVVLHNGSVAQTFFGSSNGGASENNEDVWGGTPIGFLRSVDDPWSLDPVNPNSSWALTKTNAQFAAALGMDVVAGVTILTRYDSGTPSDIEVRGFKNGAATTKHYTGRQLDTIFGLKSSHINAITLGFVEPPAAVGRVFGHDRYETGVAVSQDAFPGTVTDVFVATGENFPDAVAAATLARAMGGPVLLVHTDSVPGVVADEIVRLSPERIHILGGTAAVSAAVEARLQRYGTVLRHWGADRYATAVEIARQLPPGVTEAYVATGEDFPDGLAGAVAAAIGGSPLLLVRHADLPGITKSYLDSLGLSSIVALGGAASLDAAVVAQLDAIAPTTSIAGTDRYKTAVAVSEHAFPAGSDVVYVATGTVFADALAGGAAAAKRNGPILLVEPDQLPSVWRRSWRASTRPKS